MASGRSTTVNHASAPLRAVDGELLAALRGGQRAGIDDLVETLGVTATAVRQRVERLLEAGLIDREKRTSGRGRPTYSYGLTVLGHRQAGADHAELTEAMWLEILEMEDATVKRQLLARIARRLGRQYRQRALSSGELWDSPLESQMRALSDVLAQERISTGVSRHDRADGLPVLDITSCPYPNLTDESEQRAMCQLEEEMFSEALGRPVHLTSCRLDGDQCCQFAPAETAEANG